MQKVGKRSSQKPDAPISRHTEATVLTRPVASAHEPRAFGVVCNLGEFDAVMELSVGDLDDTKYTTMVSVDLTERDGSPFITPGATILARHRFDDAIPEIVVTLFRNPFP